MKYALIVFFVFLAVLPARAEKITIAVLDLDAKGEGLSQGVADALTEAGLGLVKCNRQITPTVFIQS
jgi:hypothetical protein